MQQNCPYCGTSLDQTSQEIKPGVRLCKTCGQEVEAAAQPAPPPPPPQAAGTYGGGDQGQSSGQTGASTISGPTEHTPAWELDHGFWLEKLWRTIWQVLLHPMLTFWAPGRMRQQYPLGFAIIIGTVGSVLGTLWDALLNAGDAAALMPIIVVFAAPIGILIGLYIGSGIMHLFLMIVGAARGGFTATFRVTGYSNAGYIFMVIPVLGGVVAGVWMMVVQIGGLAATHGVTRWRIVGAMLLFLGVLLAIIVTGALLVGCGAFLGQLDAEMGRFN